MSKPTVGYWNLRGLAEPIRYLLHYKNVDFTDKRYPLNNAGKEWFSEKLTLGLDFPNLPYYIEGNVKLTQSTTILRYLAHKHGLEGNTPEDRLRVSLAEQQITDFRTSIINLAYGENFEAKRVKFEPKVAPQLKFVADFLGSRKFLAGDYVTYVDFMAYDTLDFYHYLIPNVFDHFPTLKAYQERIRSLPELQSYLQSPTYARWPIFSPYAHFGGTGPEPQRH